MEKEKLFLNRIRELADLAYSRDIVTFTGVLNLNELNMVNSLRLENSGVKLDFYGGYEFAERQMVAFLPDALSYEWTYPIQCIKITNCAPKYSQPLGHRDYLGALIHLGIDRSTLGDILIKGSQAYVFCQEHLSDFILENLCRVKNNQVLPEVIDNPADLPGREYESIVQTVASLRLDSILAVAFHASRSSLVQHIENGNVFVNGKMVTSNGYALKEGDIVSFRGKGKFEFAGTSGQSRKGRQIIQIHRYI